MDAGRPSLVDDTERALRAWLVTGSHKPGDRLPPELELAATLGVSRGTLRTALDRLEDAGEITRRQGSGTYVGRAERPTAFREGLEVLRPYSELADRRGVVLSVRDLRIAAARLGPGAAAVFGLEADGAALTVERTVVADGRPVAVMRDVVRPGIELAPAETLQVELEAGRMVLDLLLAAEVPVAFAATRVRPRLVDPADQVGRALGVTGATAVLELTEVMHDTAGEAVQCSTDVFAPDGIDLGVRRNLEVALLAPLVRAAK